MLLSRSFVALTLLCGVALADPQLSPLITHEKRLHTPHGWSRSRKHDSNARLPLRVGLVQPNIEKIEEYLMDVSHPDSENYGNHWTAGKLAATFAPSRDSVDAVRTWLSENGISPERINRMKKGSSWIEVDVSVEEAEQLLSTEYHVYEHESGKKHIACDSYRIPEHMKEHIDIVMPTVHFNAIVSRDTEQPSKRVSVPEPAVNKAIGRPTAGATIDLIFSDLEHCDEQITPSCLRALYEIVYEPLATHKNSFAIVEYSPGSYLQSDLDQFNKNFTPSLVGKSPTLVSIDGGQTQTQVENFNYNGESDLDLQYGMNLVAPQNVTLYQTGDLVQGASFNNLLDALDGSYCTFEGGDDPTQDGIYPDPYGGGYTGPENCGTVKPANVISTSYSYNEADLTPFYTARQCAEYAKLGLLGVTVLFSSGDFGVAGYNNVCLNPNGSQSLGAPLFDPSFPSTCPYVTSVGATQVNPNSNIFEPESACEQVIYSGGGFSNYFARPSYQASVVEKFLTTYPPPYTSPTYNTSYSRGFPDISANGANYVVVVDGIFQLVFGTSCSTPVLGSILTLINDARLTIGKKPIGFINPTIYSESFKDAFNDITTGGNQGCGTPGFTAAPGWDPVTGLGTPNFPKLLTKWLLLP